MEVITENIQELRDLRTDEESFLIYVMAQAAYTVFMILTGYLITPIAIAPVLGSEDASEGRMLFLIGHLFITPLFSLPLVIWVLLAYYANVSFLWNFMMRFWTFWSFWGVIFVYFWASFFEDWFFLHAIHDFSSVWAVYPRMRWFFYIKWLVYLGDLGLTFLYFPEFLRYLQFR